MERVRYIRAISEADVHRTLDRLAEDMQNLDRGALKDVLRRRIERIELDPATRAGRVHYRLAVGGVKVASPRGFESRLSP